VSFVSSQKVRFADCDPAGIAYFPRLLALLDAAVEDWTPEATGISRRDMHLAHGLGLPTGTLATRFTAPARLEERLDIAISLTGIGRSSIALRAEARCDGTARFGATLTQVLVSLKDGRPAAWPDAWRARLATCLEADR
jgi:4-hydroxybenzoyl-CoA thioesterase